MESLVAMIKKGKSPNAAAKSIFAPPCFSAMGLQIWKFLGKN